MCHCQHKPHSISYFQGGAIGTTIDKVNGLSDLCMMFILDVVTILISHMLFSHPLVLIECLLCARQDSRYQKGREAVCPPRGDSQQAKRLWHQNSYNSNNQKGVWTYRKEGTGFCFRKKGKADRGQFEFSDNDIPSRENNIKKSIQG